MPAASPVSKLKRGGNVNRRGTTVRFHPDPEIFGKEARFQPARLYRMARSKAYLFRGVEIRWRCDPALIGKSEETPAEAVLHFPGGLGDFLAASLEGRQTVTSTPFAGEAKLPDEPGPPRMGHRLARRWRRLPQFLLQHHADARGRHPRGGAAQRPHPLAQGLWRADRQPQGGPDHAGGRLRRRRA